MYMKIIERLSQFIDLKGLSLNKFDKSISASNGYIGKQLKNKASIGVDIIEKISRAYTDLNLNWLITGEGEMLKEKPSQIIENKGNSDQTDLLLKMLDKKDNEIGLLREELGCLRNKLEFLSQNKPAGYTIITPDVKLEK